MPTPAPGPVPPVGTAPPPSPPPLSTYRNQVAGYGPLVADPGGIFDLPQGFTYRIVARSGDSMSDGFLVPGKMDGMGCFDLGGGRVALVRNHELSPGDDLLGPAGGRPELISRLGATKTYDSAGGVPLPGCTTTTVYDLVTQKVAASYLSLAGTAVNCAGGVTPWGSWLSCEETTATYGRPHGYVFEVPARAAGLVDPVPLTAMGRFRHEAAAVSPVSGIVYLTEDREDGLFYRFLPASAGRLGDGGRLQALAFANGATDARNWLDPNGFPRGSWRDVFWIDLDNADTPADDLRMRGTAKGGVKFARGEGVHFGTGELYFTCTSGGAAQLGQVMRYVPSPNEGNAAEGAAPARLQLFAEASDRLVFDYVDNLTVTPWNHLVLCEDIDGVTDPVNHLKGLTPQGLAYAIGRNAHPAHGELAGACFSPDATALFVNIYNPGITLMVTGPWAAFDSTPQTG